MKMKYIPFYNVRNEMFFIFRLLALNQRETIMFTANQNFRITLQELNEVVLVAPPITREIKTDKNHLALIIAIAKHLL